jgi:putative salt-induced outer membrane protein YdiY
MSPQLSNSALLHVAFLLPLYAARAADRAPVAAHSTRPEGSMMQIVRIACALLALVSVGAAAEADVVVLKNGDQITGTFVSVRGSSLTLQTSALGSVMIPVAQVSAVTVARDVTIVVQGGPPLRGELALDPSGHWQLTDENGTIRTIASASVDVILPADRYQSIVEHQARPWQDWTGTANLGYSVQRGNQQTNTLSSSVDSRRERPAAPIFAPHWRTNAHLTMLLSNAIEAGTSIGSNTISTSVRQDFLFAPGAFAFGIVQFDHVGTEGLSLRQTYGGGAGYDVTLSRRGTLSTFGGLTLVREAFATSGGQQSAQLLVGEKIRFQVTPRVRLDHTANAYPNVSIVGQYHLDTRTALDVKLTNRFSLNTGLIDLYLSNPAPGSRRNNFALTTGIAATF